MNTAFAAFIKFNQYHAAAWALAASLVPGLLACLYFNARWMPHILDSHPAKPLVRLSRQSCPHQNGHLQAAAMGNSKARDIQAKGFRRIWRSTRIRWGCPLTGTCLANGHRGPLPLFSRSPPLPRLRHWPRHMACAQPSH